MIYYWISVSEHGPEATAEGPCVKFNNEPSSCVCSVCNTKSLQWQVFINFKKRKGILSATNVVGEKRIYIKNKNKPGKM